MNIQNRRSKIVATIGPSSDNIEILKKMVEAGVTCIRANFSHGDHAEQKAKFDIAKQVRDELKIPLSLMLDTKGPEIRVGKMKDGAQVIVENSVVEILTMPEDYKTIEGDSKRFTVEYRMDKDLRVGDQVLVDDGKLTTIVERLKPGVIFVRAKNTHKLKSNKRINLPGVSFSLPFLSERDKRDVLFGIEQEVNYIAASFVNSKEDVQELRKLLDDNGGEKIRIISKIESKLGCENLDEIIAESNGIMVARGDLGLEIPYYEVPYMQKKMIRSARNVGKPVIVATQMLDSMENNPHPTRAEVTDVYFAVELGADSTMLSGESANGHFPLEAVQVMATINNRSEKEFYNKLYYQQHLNYILKLAPKDHRTKIAQEIVDRTINGDYRYVVVLSDTGKLLERIAMLRPNSIVVGIVKDTDLINSFGINHSIYISVDSAKLFDIVKNDFSLASQALIPFGVRKKDRILVAHNEILKEVTIS